MQDENVKSTSILDKWEEVENFLDNVFSPNFQENQNLIRNEILLYFIHILKEYSANHQEIAETEYDSLEENDADEDRLNYYKKLSSKWSDISKSLSDISIIEKDLMKGIQH